MNGGYGGPHQIIPDHSEDEELDCRHLDVTITLQSPKSKVISKLKVGVILDVELDKQTGIPIALYRNEIAGSINFRQMYILKKCLEQGNSYSAEVVLLDKGRCDVRIRYSE